MDSKSKSLNKFISETGICSRREADKLIEAGRVQLNGAVARKGNRVETGDEVKLDGKLVGSKPKTVYIALNKPRGIVCTTDSKEPKNIIDFVGYPLRLFPIGRLDKDSEGLIFLTNDGDIVNKVLRAGNAHEKEYIVEVDQIIDERFVNRMSGGIRILGTVTDPCKVEKIGKKRFRITLTQGMNRQIRRMCEYLGYNVVQLERIRIMHVNLAKLARGSFRELTKTEVSELNRLVKNSSKEA